MKSPHWVRLLSIFTLASFLEIVVLGHILAFTPIFLADIGFDAAAIRVWTGPLASAGFLIGIWFVPLWGVLAQKYGRKWLVFRSYLIETLAVVIIAFAPNVWFFLFARMLIGLALGNTGLMMASVTDAAPRTRVGFALSILSGSLPLGGVVGSLVGGYLIPLIGVRGLFGLDALLSAGVSVLIFVGYREDFRAEKVRPLRLMLGEALDAVRHTRIVATLFIFSFIYTAAYFFSYPYIPVRVTQMVGTNDAAPAIGFVLGLAGIATFVVTPLVGGIADKFGHRRLLQLLVIIVPFFWVPLYWSNDVTQLALALMLFSTLHTGIASMTNTIVGLFTPPDKRSAVMSMIFLPLNVGFLIAPTLASFVAAIEVRDVFLASALIAFVSALFLLLNRQGMKEGAPHTLPAE